MRHLFTISFLIFLLPTINSQNYYSINDEFGNGGSWSNVAYWSDVSGGSPLGSGPSASPGGSTNIFIETYVEMDVDITEFGYLSIAVSDSLQTEVNSLGIKAGATLV